AKTPTVSKLPANGFTPVGLIVLYDGLYPTTPQYDAGRMIEPPVCVPNATGTMQSATAAAEPLDEPPGVCCTLCGFAVGPGCRSANSVVTVLPRITAPASRASATHAASWAGRLPA